MAYLPPLNGGRLNASFAGNTAGASMLLSTGTMVLAGGNNVTLSQATNSNGATISINASAPSGSINFSASNTSANLASLAFSNSNGVSFGLSNGTLTASAAGGGVAISGGGTSYNSGTVNLSGGGGVTVNSTTGSGFNIVGPGVSSLSATGAISISTNGSTVSIGAPVQSAQTQSIIQALVGGTATATASTGTVSFANSNGVTFGMSNNNIMTASVAAAPTSSFAGNGAVTVSTAGSTVTIGAPVQSVQTQSNIQALIAGTGTASTGTVSFGNSNGVSFGLSNGTLTASAAGGGVAISGGGTSYNSGTVNLIASGALSINSTTGSGLNFSVPGTSSLAATGAVSISVNGNTISIGAPVQSVQTQNMVSFGGSTGNIQVSNANNVTFGAAGSVVTASASFSQSAQTQSNIQALIAGTGTASTGTVSFGNSNGVSFGLSNGTLTASAAGGGGGVALQAGGNLFSTGTVNLSAMSPLSINTGGSVVSLAGPAISSIVGVGGISVSTNGSTISISGPATTANPTTLSRWEYPEADFQPLGVVNFGALSLQHMYVPFNISGTAAKIGGSLSVKTYTAASTASVNYSLWMGLYTLNGSTLQLATSGSALNAFTHSNSAGSTSINSNIVGMRQFTTPMTINMTPGEYWVGAILSGATTYTGASSATPFFTIYGDNAYPTGSGLAAPALTPIGSGVASAQDAMLFEGIYSAVTAALPTAIQNSQINNTSASAVAMANIYAAFYNANY